MIRLSLFLLLVLASDATAQPTSEAARDLPLRPGTAFLVSAGATAGTVGIGYLLTSARDSGLGAQVIISGLMLAPSVGNLIQGNYRGALIGSGLRLSGAGLVVGGFAASFWNDSAGTVEAAVIIGGLVLVGAGVVYDTISAGTYGVVAAPSVDPASGTPLAVVRITM